MQKLTKARILTALYYDDYSPTYATVLDCLNWLIGAGISEHDAKDAIEEIALEVINWDEIKNEQ